MSKKGQRNITINKNYNITISNITNIVTQSPEPAPQEARKGLLERFTRYGWAITLTGVGILLEREELLTMETLTVMLEI